MEDERFDFKKIGGVGFLIDSFEYTLVDSFLFISFFSEREGGRERRGSSSRWFVCKVVGLW